MEVGQPVVPKVAAPALQGPPPAKAKAGVRKGMRGKAKAGARAAKLPAVKKPEPSTEKRAKEVLGDCYIPVTQTTLAAAKDVVKASNKVKSQAVRRILLSTTNPTPAEIVLQRSMANVSAYTRSCLLKKQAPAFIQKLCHPKALTCGVEDWKMLRKVLFQKCSSLSLPKTCGTCLVALVDLKKKLGLANQARQVDCEHAMVLSFISGCVVGKNNSSYRTLARQSEFLSAQREIGGTLGSYLQIINLGNNPNIDMKTILDSVMQNEPADSGVRYLIEHQDVKAVFDGHIRAGVEEKFLSHVSNLAAGPLSVLELKLALSEGGNDFLMRILKKILHETLAQEEECWKLVRPQCKQIFTSCCTHMGISTSHASLNGIGNLFTLELSNKVLNGGSVWMTQAFQDAVSELPGLPTTPQFRRWVNHGCEWEMARFWKKFDLILRYFDSGLQAPAADIHGYFKSKFDCPEYGTFSKYAHALYVEASEGIADKPEWSVQAVRCVEWKATLTAVDTLVPGAMSVDGMDDIPATPVEVDLKAKAIELSTKFVKFQYKTEIDAVEAALALGDFPAAHALLDALDDSYTFVDIDVIGCLSLKLVNAEAAVQMLNQPVDDAPVAVAGSGVLPAYLDNLVGVAAAAVAPVQQAGDADQFMNPDAVNLPIEDVLAEENAGNDDHDENGGEDDDEMEGDEEEEEDDVLDDGE